jgi:hypothetical protein
MYTLNTCLHIHNNSIQYNTIQYNIFIPIRVPQGAIYTDYKSILTIVRFIINNINIKVHLLIVYFLILCCNDFLLLIRAYLH